MAGLVQQSRGTIAAGDTTVTFSPERPASFAIHNRGSRDVTGTCAPGSVVVDVPAGDMVIINGGQFDECVLSDGGIGDTTYTLYYGDAESVAALSTSAVAGSISTAEIADGSVTTAKLGADAVTGAKVADEAIGVEHYADAQAASSGTIGVAALLRHTLAAADGNTDITMPRKAHVARAWLVMTAAGGSGSQSVQLTNGTGSNHITAAVDVSAESDKAVVEFGSLDDAYQTIAASGTLRATTANSFAGAELYVLLDLEA
jgi:hypothetical protein